MNIIDVDGSPIALALVTGSGLPARISPTQPLTADSHVVRFYPDVTLTISDYAATTVAFSNASP